ncbi:hypothetical protein Tco_0553749, partial [Tanacetum coccineum]
MLRIKIRTLCKVRGEINAELRDEVTSAMPYKVVKLKQFSVPEAEAVSGHEKQFQSSKVAFIVQVSSKAYEERLDEADAVGSIPVDLSLRLQIKYEVLPLGSESWRCQRVRQELVVRAATGHLQLRSYGSQGTGSGLGEHPFKGPESDTRVTKTVNSTPPTVAPDCLRASTRLPVPKCLRASRGVMAVLSYLGFFLTRVQCVTSSTAANVRKKPPSDAVDFVMEVVPLLTNLLRYHEGWIKCRSNCSTTV